MTTFNKKNLLSELHDRLEVVRNNLQPFLRLSEEQLNWQPAPGKWSIAEVFEHLNIAHRFYLLAINKTINEATISNKLHFKSGWLGQVAYNRIMPRADGTVFKIKTRKFLVPAYPLEGRRVLQRFLKQLDEWDHILELSHYVDLAKIRIPLSFTRVARLRLGDILRFIVAHSERHLLQAQRVNVIM